MEQLIIPPHLVEATREGRKTIALAVVPPYCHAHQPLLLLTPRKRFGGFHRLFETVVVEVDALAFSALPGHSMQFKQGVALLPAHEIARDDGYASMEEWSRHGLPAIQQALRWGWNYLATLHRVRWRAPA